MMKRYVERWACGLACAALLACGIAACSDNPAGDDQVAVTMETAMTTGSVNGGAGKIASSGLNADSLQITRVRILISRLKLHRAKEDTTTGDREIKAGPFLLTIDGSGARTLATGTVPSGSYDHVKFEFHRFSSSEIGAYLNDSTFGAFVTGERSTMIVEGRVFNDGVATDFTYKSDATANLSLGLDPPVDLAAGSAATFVLRLDPSIAFVEGGAVLDPRDPRNASKIDDGIKRAIHALKK